MNNKSLIFVGAGLLVLGLFVPIVTLPIIGSVNLFSNGSNLVATVILILAVLAAFLGFRDRNDEVIWPGGAAAILIGVLFLHLQYRISEMKHSMATELAGNPFGGIAQAAVSAVQVQWGWLVLGAGAVCLVYASLQSRKDTGQGTFAIADSFGRGIAITATVLLLAGLGLQFLDRGNGSPDPARDGQSDISAKIGSGDVASPSHAAASNRQAMEKTAYIRDKLSIYDVTSKYYDSLLDGRVPGVDFKIKNNGERTLNGVDVRVEFLDDEGNPIAEEMYYPVLVGGYTSDGTPLRPNYIWKQERGQFYSAKSVPEEWKVGSVRATIADVEFAPDEGKSP